MIRDTIVALSSGATPSAIAIVRLSGPQALAVGKAMAGTLPPERTAGVRTLHDAAGVLLDQAIVLAFSGPATATGEDVVEFHLHGGRAVVAAVTAASICYPGVRPAEAGEFTRRALLNGRIDLTQAEAIGDLLAAETAAQHRVAVRSAGGALRRRIDGWSGRLLMTAARLEALIDFDDEDDVAQSHSGLDPLRRELVAVGVEITATIAAPPVDRLRDGIRVVLAGSPNAGKSTLFNALIERDAAIVSPIAGTTRDRIEAAVAIDGVPFVLTDTAGLVADSNDPIETIGIDRAREAIEQADILLWLDVGATPATAGVVLPVHARSDVAGREEAEAGSIAVSARTGHGIKALRSRLVETASQWIPDTDMIGINQRQAQLLDQAAQALAVGGEHDPLLLAESARAAMVAFDRLTGRSGVEQMLDRLFGAFCIGK